MAKRNAAGTGTVQKKTVKRNGKEYTFWEARYTVGTYPGTGKQIQRSISGKTQKEVALKQAVLIGYIRSNPTEACILPRMEKRQIQPFDETDTRRFLEAFRGILLRFYSP